MFKSRSLSFKLRVSFGVLIMLLVFVGGINIYFLQKTTSQYKHVTTINLNNAITLKALDSSSREILRRFLQYTIKGNDQNDLERIEAAIEKNLQTYEKYKAEYEAIPFVEGEAELYEKVSTNWDAMKGFFKDMNTYAKSSKEEDNLKFANIYRNDIKASRDNFFKALDDLTEFQVKESTKWANSANETSKLADKITMITIALGMVFGVIIAYSISTGLTKQLTALTENLSEGADVVEKASTSIAKSSEDLSASVNEQSAAIQETTASTEELSAMVIKNQENAQESNKVSKQSTESAIEGKNSIKKMILAIEDIHNSNQKMMTTVNNNNVNIEEIIKVIHEIANKTKVINEIVFQTKLLSFNASVEAARAGEQGKGFAVVAEEIGSLAQMSGNAAQEISEMLTESTNKVEGIVNKTKSEVGVLMIEGKEKVEHGINVARQCDAVLDQIVAHVTSVNTMVVDITVASDEQSKGITEISKAMGQLDQATQINANSSREMALSSDELSSQAKKLNDLVTDLKDTVQGKAS